jgi:HK97 family phage major capsid protein
MSYERKEAPQGDPAQEIKSLIEQQGKAFEEFKAANDRRLKEIEKKGGEDAVTAAAVDKINAELTRISGDLKAQTAELEKKANRRGLGGDAEADPAKAEHKQAFEAWFRKGTADADLHALERKAMVGSADPNGGYLVPEEFEKSIDSILASMTAMRGLATVQKIGAPSYKKLVKTSGAASKWVGRAEEPGETNGPGYSQVTIEAEDLAAEPHVAADLLEDAVIDLGATIEEEASLAFAEAEGDAFINGDGFKQPRGILGYDTIANADWSWGKVGFVVSGGASDFASSNPSDALISLIHSLKPGFRNGASFLLNDLTLAKIRKFKDGQGNYLWQPGLQAGVPDRLLGYGAPTDDNMPDVAANAFPIAFGDFKRGYRIVDRRGIATLRDPYTKKPFVKFYTTKRVGGGIQHFQAIKLLKIST